MSNDYLELPLYLDEDDEQTVTLIAHLKGGEQAVITGVYADPVRYNGVWSISHMWLQTQATALLEAANVLWFDTLPSPTSPFTEPEAATD